MKLRKALSLTALMASAGLGLAQEQPTEQAVVQTSTKPRTLMDSFRSNGQERAQAAPAAGTTTAPVTRQVVTQGQPMYAAPGTTDCLTVSDGASFGGGFTFYGGVEYLLWRTGPTFHSDGTQTLPAIRPYQPYIYGTRSIVTDNTGANTTIRTNQTINLFGTALINPVIFDGSNVDASDRNGLRLSLGMFFDGTHENAVELRYFQLERRPASFRGTASSVIPVSNGLSDIIQNPGQDPQIVPTQFNASYSAFISSEASNRLLGLDLNLIKNHLYVGPLTFSAIAGLRYLDFEEKQHLDQQLVINNAIYVGNQTEGGVTGSNTNALMFDANARNQFLGGQVGGRVEANIGRFFATGTATVAVGGMRQETSYTETIGNDVGAAVPLSLHPGSISFEQSRTRLTFVPELALNVGCACTDNIRVFVGYDLLFIRRVVRPAGSGIPSSGDGTVTDLGATVSGRGPGATNFLEENLVAHGWNFGLEFRY